MIFFKTRTIKAFVFFLLPVFSFGQEIKGVHFEDGSWGDIKIRAKQENKYIFVDYYATWCGPCKQMDSFVYPDLAVGSFINDRFLSVKMQMDTSASDSAVIRNRYASAREIREQYKINSLPAFLFFSPNGDIVQEGVGFMASADFIVQAKQARDQEKIRYYELLSNYQHGKKDYMVMAYLALTAIKYKKPELARQIATDYKQNYLDHADAKTLAQKENLDLILSFPDLITNSNDPYFKLFYDQPEIADSAFHYQGLSALYVTPIIQKEEIEDRYVMTVPDWESIYKNIENRYGETYARDMTALSAKISFYRKTKRWQLWADSINAVIKQYPPKAFGTEFGAKTGISYFNPNDDWLLNSAAWDAFLHCDDKAVLNSALAWSELSIKVNPDVMKGDSGLVMEYLDTKANLLYKIGKTSEAIKTEKYAADYLKRAKAVEMEKAYESTIEKMEKGEKTW